MTTRNESALARARAAKNRPLARYKNLADADDAISLEGSDLTAAVTEFLGARTAQLAEQAMAPASGSDPSIASARQELKNVLLSTLSTQQPNSAAQPMPQLLRGLLKKRGGASHHLPFHSITWHWRFCVLHPHALAVHEGSDRPKALRSVVPLKHVLAVTPATIEESGGRSFGFALHTSLGRSWVFCCMGQADLDKWTSALHALCALTHASGISKALG